MRLGWDVCDNVGKPLCGWGVWGVANKDPLGEPLVVPEEGPPSLRDLPHQDTQEFLLLRMVFPQLLPAGCRFSRPEHGLCRDVHLKEPALHVDSGNL